MFYYNLGGQPGDNKTSDQISGALTLEDIQPAYWSETQISNTDDAWIFRFGGGFQMSEHRPQGPFAGWAVRTGDVPEPPALLLSGLALGALAVLSRRTRRREARYTPT
jgi:hypothetical protein